MKKVLKVILIVLGVLIGIILLDTIQALVFNNNIILGIETKCMKKEGLFVDTYHCSNNKNVTRLKKSNACYYTDVCGTKRYDEIRNSVSEAVKWNISAQYPSCTILDIYDDELKTGGTSYNSSFLIGNGYIEKEELLDVDNESYCDVYVNIKIEYENQLDHQHNCNAMYKIYLKCNNYKDEGYRG